MLHMRSQAGRRFADTSGFTLIELLISMGLLTLIIGATLSSLADVMKSNDIVAQTVAMNKGLRSSMDLIVRDMLQVGSGLPGGHTITIPNGSGATPVRLPGPPGTSFTTASGDASIPAVIPRPNAGPTINGVATDVLTVLMADNTFVNVALSAVADSSVDIAAGPNIATGPDRVTEGQLMMISKGSWTTLVQVTGVNTTARRLTFDDGDSLNLNQSSAAQGSLPALNAAAPVNSASATNITRVRMITYYIDSTTDPSHPRLVRRINNGHPMTFDNTLGTAVAMDIDNLAFTYDVSNGLNNPGAVRMVASDLTTSGACNPLACAPTQIRKINIALTGRAKNSTTAAMKPYRNTLQSEVALRGMAFVDRYRSS
jgi:type II secretory pathway pseudopilin PulG